LEIRNEVKTGRLIAEKTVHSPIGHLDIIEAVFPNKNVLVERLIALAGTARSLQAVLSLTATLPSLAEIVVLKFRGVDR
jgi:hypothetical protein